jgi:hypothetical protein
MRKSGENDLVRESWDIPRPSSESNGKDDVGWTEDAFDFRSVWQNSGQVDDPCSRGILIGERDGRRGPDVELHELGVGFEPISQLIRGLR